MFSQCFFESLFFFSRDYLYINFFTFLAFSTANRNDGISGDFFRLTFSPVYLFN